MDKAPLATKAATSAAIFGASDACAQKLERVKEPDATRLLTTTAIGGRTAQEQCAADSDVWCGAAVQPQSCPDLHQMNSTNSSQFNVSTLELNEVNLTIHTWYGFYRGQGVSPDQKRIAIASERDGIFMYEVVTQKLSVLAGFGSRGFQ